MGRITTDLILLISVLFVLNSNHCFSRENGFSFKPETLKIGDYTYQSVVDDMEGMTFHIDRAGETIYSCTKYYAVCNVMPVGVAGDITNDGTPELVIESYSGGAHCCFGYYVFSLGHELERIVYLDGIDAQFEIRDLDGDQEYEFIGRDDTFNYWNACHADSPFPLVILRYEGGALRFADELISQMNPAPEIVMKRLDGICAHMKTLEKSPMRFNTGFFMDFHPPLWSSMLDLIYTGSGDKAWIFYDLAWPEKKIGKDKFLNEFKKQLQKSPYWDELKRINGWQKIEPKSPSAAG